MSFANSLGVEFLSPTGSVGIFVLITGIIFTSMIGYVFYMSIFNIDSKEDTKIKEEKRKQQLIRISKLYP